VNNIYCSAIKTSEATAPASATPDEIIERADAIYRGLARKRPARGAVAPRVANHGTGRTRSRERRDGRSRRSSDSPPGESDDPDPAIAGQVIQRRLEELGISYREVYVLSGGVVKPATLSRLVKGTVRTPYTRTKASLAVALKMHVSEIWKSK
jgi:lambda repressor-like predicted transcriptional regulator